MTAPLVFDGCRVPAANLLGEEGQGLKIALATLDHSRLGIAAQALGMHQRALELAVQYARDRVQFGVPIAKHQAIRFQIAEIATSLAAARALTYCAASVAESASDAGRLASEAKVWRPKRPTGRSGKPSRSTAATASPRSTRSPASTGTCG